MCVCEGVCKYLYTVSVSVSWEQKINLKPFESQKETREEPERTATKRNEIKEEEAEKTQE